MNEKFVIAFIGAPGAGKSELAKAVAEKYEDGDQIVVVDDYVSHITDDMNIAVGVFGNYFVNLLIYFERWKAERVAFQTGKNAIICGSDIDSFIYAHMGVEALQHEITTPQTEQLQARANNALVMHQMLMTDFFRKSLVYYLPRPEKLVVPGQDVDPNEHFDKRIDDKIRAFILSLPVEIPMLTGTPAEKVDRILADIENLPNTIVTEDAVDEAEDPE